ncbi:MAG: aldolase [Rhizobiales bacterium PAR1]|nr:MAG: aldolase [Rhizobiales bacterium PAR1]
MSIPLPRLIVLASRILTREGILDSFGHVSARNPERPDRFFLSRARAAGLVDEADILELDLTGAPVTETPHRLFAERVIHAAIYTARPDVQAVCHHHAPQMLPFCNAGIELVPVFHLGATMGPKVPFWDSRDEFGDTNLLVSTPEQGASMAKALGPNWTLLLRRHGVTTAGRSVPELVFRTIYGSRNAEAQLATMQIGTISPLTPGEAALAEEFNLKPIALDRAWEQWQRGVESA